MQRSICLFLKGRNTCIIIVTYKTESNFKAAQSPHFALQKCHDTLIFTSLYLPHFLEGKWGCEQNRAVPAYGSSHLAYTLLWDVVSLLSPECQNESPHSALCITDNFSLNVTFLEMQKRQDLLELLGWVLGIKSISLSLESKSIQGLFDGFS